MEDFYFAGCSRAFQSREIFFGPISLLLQRRTKPFDHFDTFIRGRSFYLGEEKFRGFFEFAPEREDIFSTD